MNETIYLITLGNKNEKYLLWFIFYKILKPKGAGEPIRNFKNKTFDFFCSLKNLNAHDDAREPMQFFFLFNTNVLP